MGEWAMGPADGGAILEAVAAEGPLWAPSAPNEVPMETLKRYFWPSLTLALFVALVGLVALDRARPNPPAPTPEPPLGLPAQMEAPAHRLITVEASGWLTVDDWIVEGPVEEAHRDGRKIKLFAAAPGQASVYALAVHGRHVAWDVCRVKVVGPNPPPTPPGPTPPAPPAPPGPTPPVPPGPRDELAQALARAYAADPAPDKAEKLRALATFFAATAPAMTEDRDYRTAQELITVLHEAVRLRVGEKTLAGVREAIRQELNARVKVRTDAPLDEALRSTYRAEFARLGQYLAEVK